MKMTKEYYKNCIYERNGNWHFRKQIKGKSAIVYKGKLISGPRYICALKTRSRLEALECAKNIIDLIFLSDGTSGDGATVKENYSLKELSVLYRSNQKNKVISGNRRISSRTLEWYEQQETALLNLFGDNFQIRQMTLQLAVQKLNKSIEDGISETTLGGHRFRYLKSIFKFASELSEFIKIVPRNPLARLNLPAGRRREEIFTNENDIIEFLWKCESDWALFALVDLVCSFRPGETRQLKWEHIKKNIDGKLDDTAIIPAKLIKTRKERWVLFPKPALKVLKYLTYLKSDYVFPGEKGRKMTRQLKGMRRAFLKMERGNMSTHCLRHCWNTFMKTKSGLSNSDIEKLGGWAREKDMHEYYNHSEKVEEHVKYLKNKVNKVWAFLCPIADELIKRHKTELVKMVKGSLEERKRTFFLSSNLKRKLRKKNNN